MARDKRNHRIQVNVRLHDDENEIVTRTAKALNISKSDVMRKALLGELSKMKIPEAPKEPVKQTKVLSAAERETMIKSTGNLITDVSKMKGDNGRLGGNINQIAKAIKTGDKTVPIPELKAYHEYRKTMDVGLAAVAKELNRIWRQLA